MKRGVSFLLQNMTMLTDNYNLLRPVDKQRREEKGKQSAQYNLLPSPILAAFFIFPLIWSSAKNFSCSAVTAGLFNRPEIESGRRSRVSCRIRSRNLFAFFNILCQALFLPYNVKAGVDQVFARNFLAWFR